MGRQLRPRRQATGSDAVEVLLRENDGDRAAAAETLRMFGPPHSLRTAAAIAELSAAFNVDLSQWELHP